MLARGYAVLAKEYSGKRARKLAATVTDWVDDPRVPGRQVGWVPGPAPEYVRPVVRVAVRCQKKNGQWGIGVLIAPADPRVIVDLTAAQQAVAPVADRPAWLCVRI